MKINLTDLIYILIVFLFSAGASFYALGDIYFVLSYPVIILATNYKEEYLFVGLAGMLLAAFFIDGMVLAPIVLISFTLTYFFAFFTRKINSPLKVYLSIVACFYGFLISVGQYLVVDGIEPIFILVIPAIMGFISYHFVEIQFDFKSKEKFSLTKKQLTFFTVMANLLIGSIFLKGGFFWIHLIIFSLLNYIIIKMDKYIGLLGILVGIVLSLQYEGYQMLCFLSLAIFSLRSLEKNYHFGIGVYCVLNLVILASAFAYNYFPIIGSIVILMLTFPRKLFDHLHKYIIDPQDYELKLYQQGYYKTLNHNKKIEKVMGVLEEHLKSNAKIKKNSQKIILDDLEFLRGKLNEEVDIHLKENILNELEASDANILSFKIVSDVLDNYIIYLENRHSRLQCDEIIRVIEKFVGVKLKLKKYKYNYLLSIERFVFVNDEKIKFHINIKQRSKESGYCGDSYLNFNIKNKKYVLISDGMGHGKKASKDSSSSLFLLKNFIELGMDPVKAIVSCNVLIFDREKENFNTLDLLEYNVFDNTINLYKNGSGATYLKGKDKTIKVQSENLPLGIIENIKVEKVNIDLDLDYIILTSDGIKKELTEVISKSKAKSAKLLTNDIFQYEGEEIEDDQTIVAINVIKKE